MAAMGSSELLSDLQTFSSTLVPPPLGGSLTHLLHLTLTVAFSALEAPSALSPVSFACAGPSAAGVFSALLLFKLLLSSFLGM